MTRWRLLLRNLLFFRAANLAVLAGMVVATAVLCGALMVGDSVRGSMRTMAVQRMGPVDYALVSASPFPQDLGGRIAADPAFAAEFATCASGIMLRGGAANGSGTARTGGVQIGALSHWITPEPGASIINGELADAIGAGPGESILLTLPLIHDTPRDATLGRRARQEVASAMRAAVRQVARDRDMTNMFSLAGGQRLPRNAWVNLRQLQNEIDQPGRVNVLLVEGRGGSSPAGAARLDEILRRVATLEDFGLEITTAPDQAVLQSRSTYLLPAVQRAARRAALRLDISLREVMVYLVNAAVRLDDDGAAAAVIHYAIAAGIRGLEDGELGPEEVALNEWTAQRLGAKLGDRIRLDYYLRQSDGELVEVRSDRPGVGLTFRVARILPMRGIGADPTLTPQYKGLTDASSVADWDPPEGLKIDKSLVTAEDEEYWSRHRAAPKLFLSLATAQRLWGGTYGDLNSMRLPAAAADRFAAELRRELDPAEVGMSFMPIKARQLAAASGTTPFGLLFIGFSFFLIVAAVMLVAMLFRLGIERRARQFGLLAAVGFTPRSLRFLALGEGAVLAVVGALIGAAAGVGYTWLMIRGLTTWWVSAIGTTMLAVHIEPSTVVIGVGCGIAAALLAVIWGVWRLGRAQAASLLAGAWGHAIVSVAGGALGDKVILVAGLMGGLALLALGAAGRMAIEAAFPGGGAMLLVAALAGVDWRLRKVPREVRSALSIGRLGARNVRRHRARSLLTVALIAFACFVLVTVASMRQGPPADSRDRSTGTGGFQLIIESDIPLQADPGSAAGRRMLGFLEIDDPIWDAARFMPFRRWEGQDISCLNITAPDSPTILGVPRAMAVRGGFAFTQNLTDPWALLEAPVGESEPIPVFADQETAQYILKLPVGGIMNITDQLGRPRQLRLAATLQHSIFQGELLMAEEHFLRLFPTQSGFGVVLVESDPAALPQLRAALANELGDFSVTIESTADRLLRYQEVANTYLSTFQTLGSLGLLLGTIGLAVVLLRALVERRAELALLAALGHSPWARLRLVLSENALLLGLGLAVGTACAVVGVVPTIVATGRPFNWQQLALTLSAVAISGLAAVCVAMLLGGRHLTAASLRSE
jgi:putative ABC transport system permease protein